MPHECKNLLIRCMDFRLNKEFSNWARDSKLFRGEYDIISIAGASKDLVDGSDDIKNNFLKHIAVSAELHKVRRIIISHHSDCGAYAQSYNFNFPDEEKEKQIEDMKKAKKIISEKYPEIEIYLAWAQLKDHNGNKVEFEII